MKIIGLTGGIGSGKSTVVSMFQKLGIPVYIADLEAKRIMHENTKVVNAVKRLFGEYAYKNGVLNRKHIADLVFADKNLLSQLNAIVHPVVEADFKDFCSLQASPYLIYESALIFENQKAANFDLIIVITAPDDVRVERVVKRDGVDIAAVKSRMQNQLPQAEKIAKADFVIENSSQIATQKRVLEFHNAHISS